MSVEREDSAIEFGTNTFFSDAVALLKQYGIELERAQELLVEWTIDQYGQAVKWTKLCF